MNQDSPELIEYLSQRFDKVDSAIDYLKENKADKSDVNNLMNAVDAYAKKADT